MSKLFNLSYILDRCQRGLAWCTNDQGDGGNCCSDYDCDLDEVRKLPYKHSLGHRDVCTGNVFINVTKFFYLFKQYILVVRINL